MRVIYSGILKSTAFSCKKFINRLKLTLVICLKDILITCRRHKELMSVVNVVLNVDTVSGTAQERQCRKDIRTCDVRIAYEFQKLSHGKIGIAGIAFAGIDRICKIRMEISDMLKNKLCRDNLITAVSICAVKFEIGINDLSQRSMRFYALHRNALVAEFFRELGHIPKRLVDIVGSEFHSILIGLTLFFRLYGLISLESVLGCAYGCKSILKRIISVTLDNE